MSSSSAKVGAISALILVPLAVKLFSFTKKLSSSKDPLAIWGLLHDVKFMPKRMSSWLFYYAVGFANPFSRAINYRITDLKTGQVTGFMAEEKKNRNPFRCVHAAALVLFGETVGGLALFTRIGKKDRAILTNINAEYIKVSRGRLTATCVVPNFQDSKPDFVVTDVVIQNSKSEVVAKLALTWKTDIKGE
ncbi:hypothetical protein BGZ76_009890 [Entomortierella beljakovae]|nr:hypothetical protein BGZ76_009890 [Entomortierella beljakovae]